MTGRRSYRVGLRTKGALGEPVPPGEIDIAFTKDNNTTIIRVTREDLSVLVDIGWKFLHPYNVI